MQLFRSFLTLGLCLSGFSIQASPVDLQKQFIDLMVNKHQFDRSVIESTLAKANKNEAILKSIAKPWEAKPWHQYYPIFLTEKRLTKGLAFWQTHQQTLARAEEETGVPAEIIVAIIGVETFYGTYTGKYSVLDALVTLGFHYPPRAKFFRKELAELFLLAKEENFDITELKGSYAGAMGWGQFISSSYRHYAVDFDGDGVRDLLNNPADAIGSVANYFKKHHWKANTDIAYKAQVSGSQYSELLSKSLKYSHKWAQLEDAGVSITEPNLSKDMSVKLFEFEQPNNKEYWIGLPNFYAITRYNHSPLYAMAVFQFSQQLKQGFDSATLAKVDN
ncbi:lytic murein transglycosylase B [Paraglaciecola arctica]|uniref:Membrane-bound lytic murein transglycosylase B n=1 Tax=Paraglaciecola arctica BSs20135 TaxID=493475 RepID=K6Z3S0_9ALTE|nr:lytic murein transglycosylase B [Paraglaciecola arctica]GAC18085.1 membrane-bound lytic murein transglycosylase B [Paraglaciecola arctica BSs20135]